MNQQDWLRHEFQRVMNWIDLRREQGADVRPAIQSLRKHVRSVRSDLVKAKPSKDVARREPDRLAAIQANRPNGPRWLTDNFTAKDYRKRLHGALLARFAGCTLGAIVECWTVPEMEHVAAAEGIDFPPTDYWNTTRLPDKIRYRRSECRAYTRSELRHVPVDDDITYTMLGLLVLEEHGPDFTTEDVGDTWLRYLPTGCTAEKAALANLRNGAVGAKAALKDNPFIQWIGADIRADPWGYAAPGWPEKAAEMAYYDAMLSHRQNGVYGSMLFAAAIAAAFVVDDPLEAIEIGLTEIPRRSALATAVKWALKTAPTVRDYRHARQLVDDQFPGMHMVHTINNAALTIFGLKLGYRDVTRTIGHTVAMGLDNDCTAATAGSIVGAIVGVDGVPEHWYKPFRNRVRTYLNDNEWFRISDCVQRFTKLAKQTTDAKVNSVNGK